MLGQMPVGDALSLVSADRGKRVKVGTARACVTRAFNHKASPLLKSSQAHPVVAVHEVRANLPRVRAAALRMDGKPMATNTQHERR